MLHVGASSISLAPTFFKSQSALMPLLLLSRSQPLALGCDLVLGADLATAASIMLRLSRSKLWNHMGSRAFCKCCSSRAGPQRTGWDPVLCGPASSHNFSRISRGLLQILQPLKRSSSIPPAPILSRRRRVGGTALPCAIPWNRGRRVKKEDTLPACLLFWWRRQNSNL